MQPDSCIDKIILHKKQIAQNLILHLTFSPSQVIIIPENKFYTI